MSFLTRSTPLFRQVAVSQTRCLSSTAIRNKTVTESAKDALKSVDRAASDTIVAGIDKGVAAKDQAASAVGANAKATEGEASKVAGQAQGKAHELAGQAKGKAEEIKGKMS